MQVLWVHCFHILASAESLKGLLTHSPQCKGENWTVVILGAIMAREIPQVLPVQTNQCSNHGNTNLMNLHFSHHTTHLHAYRKEVTNKPHVAAMRWQPLVSARRKSVELQRAQNYGHWQAQMLHLALAWKH